MTQLIAMKWFRNWHPIFLIIIGMVLGKAAADMHYYGIGIKIKNRNHEQAVKNYQKIISAHRARIIELNPHEFDYELEEQ